jgi:hypothetical protein
MFFLDASADKIGIGTSSPGATIDVRGSSIFNEDGADNDFRIESDTKTSMFFLDASTDRIGINNASPAVTFDVAGAGKFTDSLWLEVSGNPFLKFTSSGTQAGQLRANGSSGIGFFNHVNSKFYLYMAKSTGGIGVNMGTSTVSAPLHVNNDGGGFSERIAIFEKTASPGGKLTIVLSDYGDDGDDDVLLDATTNTAIAIRSHAAAHYLILNESGKVGIDVSPTHTLHLPNDDAYKTTTTTWTNTSDERLKKDIVNFTDGMNIIRTIEPKKYKYNGLAGTPNDGVEYIGVLAKDIKAVAPYCHRVLKVSLTEAEKTTFPGDSVKLVSTKVNGGKGEKETIKMYEGQVDGFNPHALFFVLINASKELDAKNQELQQQLSEQQKLILQLQQRLNQLENK